jgi:hypothetical protein
MAGIGLASASKTTTGSSVDYAASGWIRNEKIGLTTLPVASSSYLWALTNPVGSSDGKSYISDTTGSAPSFVPDIGGTYVITCTVDGATQYAVRATVLDTAVAEPAEALRYTPRADTQVAAPSLGAVQYWSSTQNAMVFKYANGVTQPIGTQTPNIQYVDFVAQSEAPSYKIGRTYLKDNVLNVMTEFDDVTTQVGEELQAGVVNGEATTSLNGSPAYISGAQGQRLEVKIATSTAPATVDVIGLLTHDVDAGQNGRVTTFGLVRDLNTNSFSVGDRLYVDGAALTTTKPTAAGTYSACLGYVLVKSPSQGIVFVNVQVEPVIADVTGNRPSVPRVGESFFDTTLGHPIWWSGAAWVDATGSSV